MEILEFSALQLGFLLTLIVGLNELVKRLRVKDYWAAATIGGAAVIGGLLALYYNVDFVSGVAAGFSAVGGLVTLGSVGNKTTPTPNTSLTSKEGK